ncbi:MAG TPA: divalent metal cation transporter [Pseudolabrys sp.]|nr:divalent metal cation transporter [Pseudolabrys sp.]
MEAAASPRPPLRRDWFRRIGAGVVTGAADDDPSAIGTYASAGAKFGLSFLWIAPVLLPMMFVVVYLSAKLGRVYGKGLIAAIRDQYPRWVLYPVMAGAFAGNVIEAAANLGGIGAAVNLFVPVPISAIVVAVAAAILGLQFAGSYGLLRRIFRWLALALFAYVGAAILARPDLRALTAGTFVPHVTLTTDFLSMVVACIGTSLSAYIYTWQSNQEVEEQIRQGRRKVEQRRGASEETLRRTGVDVAIGMLFSNAILYCIILSTGAALHDAGTTNIQTAADAARALEPFAGYWAKILFALGIVGVGFLAVPVMTIGAGYDLAQGLGKHSSLHAETEDAPFFYTTIVAVTAVAVLLNFLGFNPMKALVWSGVVQGFSVPPLLLLIMLITGSRRLMLGQPNGRMASVLGWATTLATFAAAIGLVATWVAGNSG